MDTRRTIRPGQQSAFIELVVLGLLAVVIVVLAIPLISQASASNTPRTVSVETRHPVEG